MTRAAAIYRRWSDFPDRIQHLSKLLGECAPPRIDSPALGTANDHFLFHWGPGATADASRAYDRWVTTLGESIILTENVEGTAASAVRGRATGHKIEEPTVKSTPGRARVKDPT